MTNTKQVTHYTHHNPAPAQEPDTAPGNYYVSVQDSGRTGLLLGPFPNDHATALAAVPAAKAEAEKHDPFSVFYAFGTVRMTEDFTNPGALNERLPDTPGLTHTGETQ